MERAKTSRLKTIGAWDLPALLRNYLQYVDAHVTLLSEKGGIYAQHDAFNTGGS
jgi:hypothetical protein